MVPSNTPNGNAQTSLLSEVFPSPISFVSPFHNFMDFSACLEPLARESARKHSHFLWMDLNTALITPREDGRESKTCARRHYKFKCTFVLSQAIAALFEKKTTGKTFSFYTRRRWNWFSFSTFLLFSLVIGRGSHLMQDWPLDCGEISDTVLIS